MRADDRALAAVDAEGLVPDRDLVGKGALLEPGGAGLVGAADAHLAHREVVAEAGDEGPYDRLLAHLAKGRGGDRVGNRDLGQAGERCVDRDEVATHDIRTAATVGLLDAVLDQPDRDVLRDHVCQREEAGLHHGVDARAEPGVVRDAGGVDDPQVEVLGDQVLLHLGRKVVPRLAGRVGAVEQHGGARPRVCQHVHPGEQSELVAGHEVGVVDEICGPDRVRAETQVRDRHRARLLGVVDEVALRVLRRVLADQLDRGLVGAHRAVAAETEEHRLHRGGRHTEGRLGVQRQVGDVVDDAHGEAGAGCLGGELVVDGLRVSRCELLGAESVPATDDEGVALAGERRHHVEVQRLRRSSGLLGAVEYGDARDGGGKCRSQRVRGEGPVEPHDRESDLLPLGVELVDGLAQRAGG